MLALFVSKCDLNRLAAGSPDFERIPRGIVNRMILRQDGDRIVRGTCLDDIVEPRTVKIIADKNARFSKWVGLSGLL